MSYENPSEMSKNNLNETCYCPKDCGETIYFPEVSYVPSGVAKLRFVFVFIFFNMVSFILLACSFYNGTHHLLYYRVDNFHVLHYGRLLFHFSTSTHGSSPGLPSSAFIVDIGLGLGL